MTQVTRVPVGLQHYLGTQAQGKNPSELAQIVSPILDMGRFYNVQEEYWNRVSNSFSADTTLILSVPAGETWLVRSIGIYHNGGGAAGTYSCGVYLTQVAQSVGSSGRHPVMDTHTFTNNAGGTDVKYVTAEQNDLVCNAGSQLVFQFTNVSGAAFVPQCWARFIHLKN